MFIKYCKDCNGIELCKYKFNIYWNDKSSNGVGCNFAPYTELDLKDFNMKKLKEEELRELDKSKYLNKSKDLEDLIYGL